MGKSYSWYIEPQCFHANQFISDILPAENANRDMETSDGSQHNLWLCEHSHVLQMKQAKHDFPNLRFSVFVREGKNGKIRPWKF